MISSDLISEYKETLRKISSTDSELKDCKRELDSLNFKFKSLNDSLVTMSEDIQRDIDKSVQRHKEKLLEARRTGIREDIDGANEKLKKLEHEKKIEKSKIIEMYDEKSFPDIYKEIQLGEQTLTRAEEKFNGVLSEDIIKSIQKLAMKDKTNYSITELCKIVNKHSRKDFSRFKGTSYIERFTRDITFKSDNFNFLSNKFKFYVFALWILVLFVVLVKNLEIFLIPYSALLFASISMNMKNTKKLVKYYYPYVILHTRLFRLKDNYNDKLKTIVKKKFDEIDANYFDIIEAVKSEINEYKLKLNNVSLNDLKVIDEDGIRQKALDEGSEGFNFIRKDISDTKETIESLERNITSLTRHLESLHTSKQDLLKQVEEHYLNPKIPGSEKTLVKSFFLGLTDDGELISFDYKGLSTLIVYRGENNTVNTPLITMMLMQLLASMSANSLKVTISDLYNACLDFSVFSQQDLEDVIELCHTDQEITKIIDAYHADMITRTKTILTKDQSLEDYNMRMLKQDSLTMHYCILLLQDLDFRIISSQKFQQLCRSGPRVGIIPITFLSREMVASAKKSGKQELEGIIKYMEIVIDNTFTFDGSTQDLVFDEDITANIIDDLNR